MYCRDLKQGSHAVQVPSHVWYPPPACADQAQMVVVLDCSIASSGVCKGFTPSGNASPLFALIRQDIRRISSVARDVPV
jgi:hypothetical protein